MIKEFGIYLSSVKGYSENTVIAYNVDLRSFARFIKQRKSTGRWSTVTREDIDLFMEYEQYRGVCAKTVNRKLAAISSLYDYMKREGMDVENPCRWETRQKTEDKVINTIPVDDLKSIISKTHGRTKILIQLLATTGIRIQEALDIRVGDIMPSNCSIKIHGKGGKQRYVYTTVEVMDEIRQYMPKCAAAHLFTGMTQRSARYDIYNAMKGQTDAKQLSPHAIRHTFATEIAANGMEAPALAELLGHSSIKTTQKYIDSTKLRVQQQYIQFKPF